jgi:CO dehydrogenase/acetyl-CoA synthase beta subunit
MLVAKFWLAMRGHSGVGQRVVTAGGQPVKRQEIWIRLASQSDSELETAKRVKQIQKAVERLMLTVIEVRSVQVTKVVDEEF